MDAKPRLLSPQDTAFLALERGGAPMNIGIAATFDAAADPTAHLDLIQRVATTRLHALEAAGWRAEPSGPRGRYVWVAGAPPRLLRVRLPSRGGRALLDWFGDELGRGFEPGHPLWRGWLVHGFECDRFALVLKAHHALVDGVGGLSWWRRLFDGELTDRPTRARRPRVAGESRALAGAASVLGASMRRGRPTPLNGPLGPERVLTSCSLPLDLLRALQRGTSGSVNEVLLALVGASLDEVLRAEPGAPPLRALYPVNRRLDNGAGAGNQLGGTLVELGTGESLEGRLASIRRETRSPRRTLQSRGVEVLGRAASLLPARATPLIFSLAGRYRVFNAVFSALRGSRRSPTIAGVPLRSAVAFGPLFPQVRCNITALRSDRDVTIGITSTRLPGSLPTDLCAAICARANAWATELGAPVAVRAG